MFKGMIAAIPTPFLEDYKVDDASLRRHVSWLIEEGVDGILVCGTTGETPTLSEEEQFCILKTTLALAKGKTAVIMGTGCNDTRKSLQRTMKAKDLGADGCLVVVPYYNRPTFQGCLRHFQEVAKAEVPLIVYHHPQRTGLSLSADQLACIAQLPQVAAIKEGGADIELTTRLCRLIDKPVFSGVDGLTMSMMAAGAGGVISVLGNLIPREWTEFVCAFAEGRTAAALSIFNRFYALSQLMFLETNPQCVKYALKLMGRFEPYLRLPLLEPTESSKALIEQEMIELELMQRTPDLQESI